jgi:arylsulfatase A-like enzyme
MAIRILPALTLASLCCCGASAQSRPNIIFLLTDDQRWNTLGAMGDTIIRTPEIDALAKQGVAFDNAFATTAICFASRSTIFSGQHVIRNGFKDFADVFTPEALAQTYPLLLRKAGYQTGFIGKWGLGDPLPATAFDNWYGYSGQGDYEIKSGGVVVRHLTPKMGDQALDFLGKTSTAKPFCLSISFKAPHIQDGDPRQFIPDSADMGLYTQAVFAAPPNSDPAFFAALPAFLKDTNTELRKRWVLEYRTPALYQESMKNYYRLISGVDHVVGRIRRKLAEMGADKNTILIFSADHGMFIGDRGFAGKWLAYDPSIRVPMILYDPRFPAAAKGTRRSEMALNLDIPETILSLAGVPVPPAMQGRDLTGLIDGRAKQWRTEFFYQHLAVPYAAPPSEGLVGTRYKYIAYVGRNPPYAELYDLKTDPHESVNLIANAKYKAVLDSLKLRFDALRASSAKDDDIRELTAPVAGPTGVRAARAGGRSDPAARPFGYDAAGKTLPRAQDRRVRAFRTRKPGA